MTNGAYAMRRALSSKRSTNPNASCLPEVSAGAWRTKVAFRRSLLSIGVPSYHYRAVKLGVTMKKTAGADEFSNTKIGRWLTDVLGIRHRHRPRKSRRHSDCAEPARRRIERQRNERSRRMNAVNAV
ncbi:MAG: Adenylosuccinate lyase (EC [uncultured Paraburkholderia sp.]|nr:MAG: Adenylosuccinate lyase (EC [uncultured Paraburkholderia sp.]CAH2927928.1 MAG: Adenylosuccinate lyase (EC [uncultured Paraburkholderia sp.]